MKYRLKKDLPGIPAGTVLNGDGYGMVHVVISGATTFFYPPHHEDWFEEVKPERWKPELGQLFYFLCGYSESETSAGTWGGDNEAFEAMRDRGNCFRTREQAEEAARRVRQTLSAYQDEILIKTL